MDKVTILFLAANPTGTIQQKLDEEIRAITEKIRASKYRDVLELKSAWAVRPDDLLQSLNVYKPQIVHFSGQGSGAGEIILVDRNEAPKVVSTSAVKALFTTLKDNIHIVILNACYSRSQAEAITKVIDCAIGMNDVIGHEAAIIFAASFYRAIGFGRSVQEAFDQGKTALLLEGIPEENTPELLVKSGVKPSQIILIQESSSNTDWIYHEVEWIDGSVMVILPVLPSSDGRALGIGKYPVTNAQYRKFVEDNPGSEPVGEHFQLRRTSQKSVSTSVRKKKESWQGPFYPWREKEFNRLDQPVVCVSFEDAEQYCEWVMSLQEPSSLTRLPTVQEWDIAAFGTPFPSRNRKVWLSTSPYIWHRSVAPAPIDSTGNRSNVRGISDLIGNIWEWCGGGTEQFPTLVARERPEGEADLRGGSFLDDLTKVQPFLSARMLREQSQIRHSDLGFRIAAEIRVEILPQEVRQRLSLCKPLEGFSFWAY